MTLIKTLAEVVSLFNEKRNSDIALVGSNDTIFTYGRLAWQVQCIRSELQNHGLEKGHRIALIAPRGSHGIAAFLGITSFSICVPLPAHLRLQEVKNIFKVLQVDALLCTSDQDVAIQVARFQHIPVILIEDSYNYIPVGGPIQPDLTGTENDIAVLMQTSGSTSSPKVVALSHKHIISAALNIIQALQLTPNDRCLNLMPFYHVHGLISAGLSSMLAGSSMYCPDSFDEKKFFDWFSFFKPTWFTGTPTMLQAILDEVDRSRIHLNVKSLRFFRGASAAVPVSIIDKLESFFGAPLIETYGLTESASLITTNPLPPGIRKPGSVGLVVGAEIRVIDNNGNDCNPFHIGEIIIRGPSVITKYESDPDDVQKAFINGGWLRTGDLGYFDSDDYLYVTDRIKEVVNRGGQLISLREVDSIILKNPQVNQAVSFSIDHPTLGEDFVTAVVLALGVNISEDEIRRELLESQSSFKVPSGVLIVNAIPVNRIGKVVRRELRAYFSDQLIPKGELPATDIQAELLEVWQFVLKRSDFGISDNVFVLGGDPRRTVKIMDFIVEKYEIHLSFSQLFLNNTIAKQARLLERPSKLPSQEYLLHSNQPLKE